MNFKSIQERMFKEYVKNKYLDTWNYPLTNPTLNDKAQNIYDIAEIGLINTEVSEAMEKVRHDDYSEELDLEMADIVIRCMNFCSRKGINLEDAILKKYNINNLREILHGKKV